MTAGPLSLALSLSLSRTHTHTPTFSLVGGKVEGIVFVFHSLVDPGREGGEGVDLVEAESAHEVVHHAGSAVAGGEDRQIDERLEGGLEVRSRKL